MSEEISKLRAEIDAAIRILQGALFGEDDRVAAIETVLVICKQIEQRINDLRLEQ